jgi:hypothetical protein
MDIQGFFVVVVLEFELMASHLIDRCSTTQMLYDLSYTSIPFL